MNADLIANQNGLKSEIMRLKKVNANVHRGNEELLNKVTTQLQMNRIQQNELIALREEVQRKKQKENESYRAIECLNSKMDKMRREAAAQKSIAMKVLSLFIHILSHIASLKSK